PHRNYDAKSWLLRRPFDSSARGTIDPRAPQRRHERGPCGRLARRLQRPVPPRGSGGTSRLHVSLRAVREGHASGPRVRTMKIPKSVSIGAVAPTKKVHFVSLGCVKNRVDTEVMLGVADGAGWSIVDEPADAEVIVVNTCGFIGEAKKESIDTIFEMAEY